MNEVYYAVASCLLLIFIALFPLLNRRFDVCPAWKPSNPLIFSWVIALTLIPRIIFSSLIFKAEPIDEYLQALHSHTVEVIWHGNFESTFSMILQYFASFLAFGTTSYQPFVTTIVSIASTLVGVLILKRLKLPAPYVIAVPVLLSWMRMYPELIWTEQHDVYILFFSVWFIHSFIEFVKTPDKKNALLLGMVSVFYLWINPTNFVILPVLFILLWMLARIRNVALVAKPLVQVFIALIVAASAQCAKTYLSTGLFAPTGLGGQLVSLNLYRHFQTKSDAELRVLFDKADVPYWYRRCYETPAPGRSVDIYWRGSLGDCFTFFDRDKSDCRGPDYDFTRDRIINPDDDVMQAMLHRDMERACAKPYLFTVGFPEVGTEFGVEYQKVNSRLAKTWFLTDPLDVMRRAFLVNYPLYELKGAPLLTSNYFAPFLEEKQDLGAFQPLFRVLSKIVKLFNLMMVFAFHAAIGGILLLPFIPRLRRRVISSVSHMTYAEMATAMMLLIPKLMAMIIYCLVAGGEGERYWQYFSWQMVCIDIFFLVWIGRELIRAKGRALEA